MRENRIAIYDYTSVSNGRCKLAEVHADEDRRFSRSFYCDKRYFESFRWEMEGFWWVALTCVCYDLTFHRGILENIGG